jgi:hypothetical protein
LVLVERSTFQVADHVASSAISLPQILDVNGWHVAHDCLGCSTSDIQLGRELARVEQLRQRGEPYRERAGARDRDAGGSFTEPPAVMVIRLPRRLVSAPGCVVVIAVVRDLRQARAIGVGGVDVRARCR